MHSACIRAAYDRHPGPLIATRGPPGGRSAAQHVSPTPCPILACPPYAPWGVRVPSLSLKNVDSKHGGWTWTILRDSERAVDANGNISRRHVAPEAGGRWLSDGLRLHPSAPDARRLNSRARGGQVFSIRQVPGSLFPPPKLVMDIIACSAGSLRFHVQLSISSYLAVQRARQTTADRLRETASTLFHPRRIGLRRRIPAYYSCRPT